MNAREFLAIKGIHDDSFEEIMEQYARIQIMDAVSSYISPVLSTGTTTKTEDIDKLIDSHNEDKIQKSEKIVVDNWHKLLKKEGHWLAAIKF